jgi:uncharacterized RDD family membrane protein YckC
MAESIFCSQCGTENTAGAVFCQRCGAGLQLRPAPAAPYAYAAPAAAYGGFWIRFVAILIDTVIIRIAIIPIAALLGVFGMAHHPIIFEDHVNERQIAAFVMAITTILLPVYICINWLYEALLTSSEWQGTVGKKLLSLKVTDEAGNRISFLRATGRHFAKFLSSILLIGFIMAAFTEGKRALHDILAGTLVRKG